MDPFEVTVQFERFRVSERTQPDGALSYDLSWLNGPAAGTYGFAIGRSAIASDEGSSNVATGMTREELTEAVRGFVESYYEPGGIGSGDFPDHISARARQADGR